MSELDASRFVKVPVAEIVSPEKSGPLWPYRDHWWAVTADDCVLIYKYRGFNSPLCNVNLAIVGRRLNYPEPTTARLLPWAYLPFSISEYT